MVYQDPNNLTTLKLAFDYADSTSGGYFYILIPFSLWFTAFLFLKGKGFYTGDCAMAASFGTFLVCAMLFVMGAFTGTEMLWMVIALFVSALVGYWQDQKL